jgi:hypothetical protein
MWAPALTAGVFALFLGGFPWLASRVRRRGIGMSVLEPIQDMWDPITYRTQTELHIQAERQEPSPLPDDPLRR